MPSHATLSLPVTVTPSWLRLLGPFNTSSGVKASQAVGYETVKGGGFSTSWTACLFTRLYSG